MEIYSSNVLHVFLTFYHRHPLKDLCCGKKNFQDEMVSVKLETRSFEDALLIFFWFNIENNAFKILNYY